MDKNELLKIAILAALDAGEEILKVYETDFYVETKSDHTPVTLADKGASRRILNVLSQSSLPIICEEEEVKTYSVRKNWKAFWMVDPLDGTKEFIKRSGEFSVNIALIENGAPTVGVIYTPVLKDLYFSTTGKSSYKLKNAETYIQSSATDWFEKIIPASQKLPLQKLPKNYTIVASRSYLSRAVNARIDKLTKVYGFVDVINIGSSIKQCWVAEGKAHEYPRYGTTMEWDTAAGQCILEGAGKNLIDLDTMLPMRYNKEKMENNFFVAGQ
jgi:3'(2'), 5'-bisphosphate nucleotidase